MGCTESKAVRRTLVRRLSKGHLEEDEAEHYSLKEHLVLQRKSSKRHHSFRNTETAIVALEREESEIKVEGIVSDWDAAKLAKAIAASEHVKSVSVEFDIGVECTANGIRSVATAAASSSVVETLRVTGGGNSAAIVIGDVLQFQPDTSAMRRVHLASGTKIFANGIAALTYGIRESSKLEALKLPLCQLEDSDLATLAEEGFKHSASLASLDLSNNHITSAGFASLTDAMTETRLQNLTMRNNAITDVSGALNLQDLRELRIGRNGVKNNLETIAALLERNQLECLDLECNQITAEGISILCAALPNATGLLELNLSGNAIGDDAAKELIETLPAGLQVLSLRTCCLSSPTSRFLADNLHRFAKLRVLGLSDNRFGNEGVTDVFDALKDHLHVETVAFDRDHSLAANEIVPIVIDRLRMHRSLVTLTFKGLSLTDENQARIEAMLANLRSDRARTMTLLCSALAIPRKDKVSKCAFGTLPVDLVRELGKFLYA